MRTIHTCACRAAKNHYQSRNKKPLFLVTTRELAQSVRNAVGSLLGPDSFNGSSWNLGSGEMRVRTFQDTPPKGDFELVICNEGERLSKEDTNAANVWRKAAR